VDSAAGDCTRGSRTGLEQPNSMEPAIDSHTFGTLIFRSSSDFLSRHKQV
jgi:hypothetical protein